MPYHVARENCIKFNIAMLEIVTKPNGLLPTQFTKFVIVRFAKRRLTMSH
jgi:hypothetical protein